jgi:protein-L-isoaspartate O-methyltransferase
MGCIPRELFLNLQKTDKTPRLGSFFAGFKGHGKYLCLLEGIEVTQNKSYTPLMRTKLTKISLPVCLWLLSLLTIICPAKDKVGLQPEAPIYEFHKEHDRDGINKFYQGREIAQVMGHQGADWLERPEREQEEKPGLLLDALKLKPGDAVADIGAGTGYYTRRLARKVGEKGVVYAVEIQQEMLDILTNKMAELKISNVKPVLGTITDPKLPRGGVDLILMVDVYHEFDHPYEMTHAMVGALKSGGRIVFVEFRGEDPKVPIKPLHKMTEAQVRKEMAAFPLEWAETSEVLPIQHIIFFRKK